MRRRETQARAVHPSLLLYTAAHFFVDFISIYLILGRIIHDDRLPVYLIIYNFCAFAGQMPLGVAADLMDRCERLSVAGTGILAVLVFPGRLVTFSPAVLAAVTGLGNALFHIGCGTRVLRWSENLCEESGNRAGSDNDSQREQRTKSACEESGNRAGSDNDSQRGQRTKSACEESGNRAGSDNDSQRRQRTKSACAESGIRAVSATGQQRRRRTKSPYEESGIRAVSATGPQRGQRKKSPCVESGIRAGSAIGEQRRQRMKMTCRDSGIFVSAGALGLFYGRKCAGMEPFGSAFWIPVFCIYLILLLLVADSHISGTLAAISGALAAIPGTSPIVSGTSPRISSTRPPDYGEPPCISGTRPPNSGAFPRISGTLPEKDAPGGTGSALSGPRVRHRRQVLRTVFCVCALALVVVLRSYLGVIVRFPWRADYPLLLVCCVVLGKMLGGGLADLFGETRTIVVSLLFTSVLFLASSLPAAGLTSLLLFNMTMPVTLTCLAEMIGMPGLAFGLLTFALYIGCLPSLLGMVPASFLPVLYAAISLVSLVLMLVVWRARETI
ncbi:MAG: hypothetical protein Q4D81_14545 [Eubacteriales bacterium]|nr:hypothetical protein [Eubacteriales bacterium]